DQRTLDVTADPIHVVVDDWRHECGITRRAHDAHSGPVSLRELILCNSLHTRVEEIAGTWLRQPPRLCDLLCWPAFGPAKAGIRQYRFRCGAPDLNRV